MILTGDAWMHHLDLARTPAQLLMADRDGDRPVRTVANPWDCSLPRSHERKRLLHAYSIGSDVTVLNDDAEILDSGSRQSMSLFFMTSSPWSSTAE